MEKFNTHYKAVSCIKRTLILDYLIFFLVDDSNIIAIPKVGVWCRSGVSQNSSFDIYIYIFVTSLLFIEVKGLSLQPGDWG